MADAQTGVFCINTVSSRLHNLVSGKAIQYLQVGTATPVAHDSLNESAGVTGIVFALPGSASIGTLDSGPLKDGTALWTTSANSQIGDPAVSDYALTTGDISHGNKASTGGNLGTERIKNGSAQKFVNAILDGAY